MPGIPLFIDCDTGIDDALALAYLLADEGVNIVGIGAVSGNTSATRGALNTLALLEAAGRDDIPVALGDTDFWNHPYAGGSPHVHGADGVGGLGLEPRSLELDPRSATDLLADLARQYPGQLRVLALGPLTNMARFAEAHPAEVQLIERVVVMGGAFDVLGNVSEAAEANIHNDPEAAAIVCAGEWPLTFVPLDVTMKHLLTRDEADEIGRIPGAVPVALRGMLDIYLDFYAEYYGFDGCALHDPLAALLVADAVSVTEFLTPDAVGVVTETPHRGRTVALSTDGDPTVFAGPERIVVQQISRSASEVLRERLAAHDWPA